MSDESHDRWHSAPGSVTLKRVVCFRAYREKMLSQVVTSELRRELPHGRRVPELILRFCAPSRTVIFQAELFDGSPCSFWVDTGRRELLISGNLRFLVKEQNGDAFDYRFVPEERPMLRKLFPAGASVNRVRLIACYIHTPSRTIMVQHGQPPDRLDDPYVPRVLPASEKRLPSDAPPSN